MDGNSNRLLAIPQIAGKAALMLPANGGDITEGHIRGNRQVLQVFNPISFAVIGDGKERVVPFTEAKGQVTIESTDRPGNLTQRDAVSLGSKGINIDIDGTLETAEDLNITNFRVTQQRRLDITDHQLADSINIQIVIGR